MKITDKYYVSGRGVVLVGAVEKGERWPVVGTAMFTYPDGTTRRLDVAGIETAVKLTAPPTTSNVVGVIVINAYLNEPFEGGTLSFNRRLADRRTIKDRRK